MRKTFIWTIAATLITVAVAWYSWIVVHKWDYGAVLICMPGEKSEKLAFGKYAYELSKLSCGGADGSFVLETNFEELYKRSYRIVQIIQETGGIVYYVHKG